MDIVRTQSIVRRYSKAMEREIESWANVEKAAEYISERPYLHSQVDLHNHACRHVGIAFKFEQKFDPVRAASLQDEISDLVNAERYSR